MLVAVRFHSPGGKWNVGRLPLPASAYGFRLIQTHPKKTSKLAEGALAMLAPHELPFKAFLACWFEFGFTIMSLSALDILKSITVNRHSGVVGPTRN